MPESLTHVLERALHQRVALRLKDNRELRGRLLGLDEHLNLFLDDVEERTEERSRHLGKVVLRGSNVSVLHALGTGSAGQVR